MSDNRQILVMDEEHLIRKMLKRVCEAAGHTVLATTSSPTALYEAMNQFAIEFDTIIASTTSLRLLNTAAETNERPLLLICYTSRHNGPPKQINQIIYLRKGGRGGNEELHGILGGKVVFLK